MTVAQENCRRCNHTVLLHVATDGCLARNCTCALSEGAARTMNEKTPTVYTTSYRAGGAA